MSARLRLTKALSVVAAVLAVALPTGAFAPPLTPAAYDLAVPQDYVDLVEHGLLENVSMVDYRWKYSTLLSNGKYVGSCGCQNTVFATVLNWFFPLNVGYDGGDTIPHATTPVHSWWDQKGTPTGHELVWSPTYVDAHLTLKGGYKPNGGNGAGGCGTNAEPWALAEIGAARVLQVGGARISAPTGLEFTVHDTPGQGGLDNDLRSLILAELNAGRPVAVMRAAPMKDKDGNPTIAGHGNIIVGYNPQSRRFLALDPAWPRDADAQEGAVRANMRETYEEWEKSIVLAYTFDKAYRQAGYSTLGSTAGSGTLRAPADYHLSVTRPDGRRAGWDPGAQRYVVSGRDFAYRALTGASLVDDVEVARDAEKLYVAGPRTGTYRYEVHGVTSGAFALTLADEGDGDTVERAALNGDVTAGQVVKIEAARDADGTTRTTTVAQFTPEPMFDAPKKINTADELTVDATASFDADGEIVDWAWDFGDGTTAQGSRATHGYQAPGEYDVRLTVTDDAGATRAVTRHVTVTRSEEQPPEVRIEPEGGPFHRDPFNVRISATDNGRGVRTMTYQATGATTLPETTVAGGGPVTLPISAEGTTTITARAVDREGNHSAPVTTTVGIDTAAPTSLVTTPLADGETAGLGIVAGSVSGTTAGARSVEIALTRTADNKYWDGSAWVDAERWLTTSTGSAPEDRWYLADRLPAGTDLPKGTYRVRSRAVDLVGNAETPGDGISFTVTASKLPAATPTRLTTTTGETVQLEAVDDDGTVVGRASGAAVRWAADGTRQTLPALPGYTGAWARDLVNGVVVGSSIGSSSRATVWRDGEPQDLGTLPGGGASDAYGVDSHGVAVGYAVDDQGRRRPVRFGDTVVPLAAPPGLDVAVGDARAVSPNGRYVVGVVRGTDGNDHLARWDGDSVTLLDGLAGSVPTAVNDSGAIAGLATVQSSIHAVMWDDNGAHDLGPGSANGIDNRGIVVGTSGVSGGSTPQFAAAWQDGSLLRLQDQLPAGSGWSLNSSRAINQSTGIVVGSGMLSGAPAQFRMTVPSFTADTTPPKATATPHDDAWHSDDVELTVRATDADSGVASIRTSVTGDVGGDTATVKIKNEGITEIAYTAVDKAGNTAAAQVVKVRIDRTAPTLSAQPESAQLWARGPVTIKLHAEDGLSGVDKLHVKVDDQAKQVIAGDDGTVEVTGDGEHEVIAWATDRAGNVSAEQHLTVRIDATAPKVTLAGAADGASVARGTTVALSVSDATSGLAGRTVTHAVGDTTEQENGATVSLRADGVHRIEVTATDVAGNTATAVLSATVSGEAGPAAQLGEDGPVAVAGGPYTIVAGTPLQLDGSGSSSPSGAALSYRWDLPDTKDPVEGVRPTLTLNVPGLYLVSLVVSDGARVSSPDWVTITVVEPPAAEHRGTVNAGRAIPVEFSVRGEYGLDVFAAAPQSYPSTAKGVPTGPASPAEAPGNSGLTMKGNGRYQWVWKTDKAWAGTTRTLVLKLRDGTEHRVVCKFR